MSPTSPIREVVDLTDPATNIVFNMSLDEARQRVASGDPALVRQIEGQFALTTLRGQTVRMARSLGFPLRYFIVKKVDGPALVVSDRIDSIKNWLDAEGFGDQFHPSYTRMVPAHYIITIELVGCPDPNPTYARYFEPKRNALPTDVQEIGRRYVAALYDETVRWLRYVPPDVPIGVCFSGGVDSGAVFLTTYRAMLDGGHNLARLKAFTLSVDGGGEDLAQARQFLEALDLQLFLEVIDVRGDAIDVTDAIRVIEDYKPLDIDAGAMTLALCRGIRERYPEWRYLLDGDGGDENLKDYPIEENPELTINSVFNNLMLYHEGWGVHSIKHSLTYSGGLSRGCTRTYAPSSTLGFEAFSPFKMPSLIEIAEGIPFADLTDKDHERLYDLKGKVVAAGIKVVTGIEMPVFEKRRFQHGAFAAPQKAGRLLESESAYRRVFNAVYQT
jgi:asparagine synthase (glutamine-hydrolysing)